MLLAMINFVYKQEYYPPGEKINDFDTYAIHDINVYAIADKYNVVGLKKYAAGKFEPTASMQWSQPLFATFLTKIYRDGPADSELKRYVYQWLQDSLL